MALSNYTFTDTHKLLAWANGKVNVMFCVKLESDVPASIATLVSQNATHRAVLELGVGPLVNAAYGSPGWDSAWYIVEMSNSAELASFFAETPADLLARVLLVEFNNWDVNWPDKAQQLTADLVAVHGGLGGVGPGGTGARAVPATHSNGPAATVANHMAIYDAGFDVAYTYNLANAVAARIDVNSAKGLAPP
jgi:hypothetical protein